jgi:sensor histidine kinase regulating citrate/malate metabolism
MFLTLLVVTFVVTTMVSLIVARAFAKPIDQILKRIIADEISAAWRRYMMFALYVVGISSGVRIWDLEKYITKPAYEGAQIVELSTDRWILEVYRTIIETLQGLAWVLLVFFVCALFAFVLVRIIEIRNQKKD